MTCVGATPIVPMTYAALLEAYGWERFAADAADRGATSLIVSDVPAGQRPELRRIHLVAPTSTDERIALAASTTDGWLYLVTLTGTTGARAELSSALEGLVGAGTVAGGRRPALRGVRHLDAGAGRRGRVPRGRRRGRVPGRSGGRGRPGRPRGVRRDAPRGARRRQCLTRTRLPQREHRARRCVRKNRLPSGNPVPEDPAEVSLHGSGPTRTSIFPTLAPSSIPMNAAGACSIPSTTVSRYRIDPELTSGPTSARNAGKRS